MNTDILSFVNKSLEISENPETLKLLVATGMFALRDYLTEHSEYAPRFGDRALASDLLEKYPTDTLMKGGEV